MRFKKENKPLMNNKTGCYEQVIETVEDVKTPYQLIKTFVETERFNPVSGNVEIVRLAKGTIMRPLVKAEPVKVPSTNNVPAKQNNNKKRIPVAE